jgi:hypothetical protein
MLLKAIAFLDYFGLLTGRGQALRGGRAEEEGFADTLEITIGVIATAPKFVDFSAYSYGPLKFR